MSGEFKAFANTEGETVALAPAVPSEPIEESVNLDAPEAKEPEVEEADGQEAEGEDGGQPSEPEEDEYEEVDWDGEKYTVPKKLKPALLRQSDYTRKAQEIAATKKELEAREAKLVEQSRVTEEDLNARAQYMSKKAELEQYANVDWQTWVQQDPVAAQSGYIRAQELRNEVQGLESQISEHAKQRSEMANSERNKRLQETDDFARTVPGYTPDVPRQVVEFASKALPQELSFSTEELQAAMNPRIYNILRLAKLGHQVETQPVAKPPPQKPTPLTVVKSRGNQPVSKSLEDMSTEEYVAFRKRQMKA